MTALAYDDAAERLRAALELGIADARERGEALLELGTARHRGGPRRRRARGVPGGRRDRRELDDPSCSRAPRSASRTRAGGRGSRPARAVDLLERGRRRARRARRRSCASACSPGSRARCRSRATTSAAPRSAPRRSRMARLARRPRRARPGAGRQLLVAAQVGRAEEVLDDADRGARHRRARSATSSPRTEAMSWRVSALCAISDVDAARREVDGGSGHRRADQRSRSSSTSPSTPARRSRSARAGSRTPRRWRALARVEPPAAPAATRPACYGIQMFSDPPRAGPARRAGAGGSGAGGQATPPGRPASSSLLADLGMEAEARRRAARACGEGSSRSGRSLWLAGLTYLTDACAAHRRRRAAGAALPRARAVAGTQRR